MDIDEIPLPFPPLWLGGPPVDPRRQRALGIRAYVPAQGSGQRLCVECGAGVWLGPKQLEVWIYQDGQAICFECAAKKGLKCQPLGKQGDSYAV